jgi:hypothetical protein
MSSLSDSLTFCFPSMMEKTPAHHHAQPRMNLIRSGHFVSCAFRPRPGLSPKQRAAHKEEYKKLRVRLQLAKNEKEKEKEKEKVKEREDAFASESLRAFEQGDRQQRRQRQLHADEALARELAELDSELLDNELEQDLRRWRGHHTLDTSALEGEFFFGGGGGGGDCDSVSSLSSQSQSQSEEGGSEAANVHAHGPRDARVKLHNTGAAAGGGSGYHALEDGVFAPGGGGDWSASSSAASPQEEGARVKLHNTGAAAGDGSGGFSWGGASNQLVVKNEWYFGGDEYE